MACATHNTALAADWLRAQSEHFVVTTDGTERRVREYLHDLESLHHVVQMLLGVDAAKAQGKPKFELYLLQSNQDMGKVRPYFANKFSGVYMQCDEGSVAYVSVEHGRLGEVGDWGLSVLFHEYAHHMMFQYATRVYPPWYVEGFAEFLGHSEIDGDKVVLGGIGRQTAWQLRERPWIDFEKVFQPPFKATGEKDVDDSYFMAFYAQSWLLTHYMLSDSERTRKFNNYFARIGAGEDPRSAFESATNIPVATLRGLLKNHLNSLPVINVSSNSMPKIEVVIEPLPAEVDRYVLDASVLKTCPGKEYGQILLERLHAAASKGAASEGLSLALARAELLYGQVEVATASLQKIAAAEGNFEAQYLLGRVLEQSAETLNGEARDSAREQARAQYFKAYRLKKNDAPNLYHLAHLLAREGATPNALNAAQGARALAPGVSSYALFEAWLDLEGGQPERALRALAPLASNPHDLKFAAQVREAMAAIRAGKSKVEVQRLLSTNP
jgi:tetratricopeptide (TPR) repeat protein